MPYIRFRSCRFSALAQASKWLTSLLPETFEITSGSPIRKQWKNQPSSRQKVKGILFICHCLHTKFI